MTTDRDLLGSKDAYHMPAIVCDSADCLEAGESVRFIDSQTVERCRLDQRDGIVDPFAKIGSDEYFLDPKKVSNVTHNFTVSGVEEARDYYDSPCRNCS